MMMTVVGWMPVDGPLARGSGIRARLEGSGNIGGNRTHKGKNNDASKSSELVKMSVDHGQKAYNKVLYLHCYGLVAGKECEGRVRGQGKKPGDEWRDNNRGLFIHCRR